VRERRQSEKTDPRVFGTSFWCAQLSQSPVDGDVLGVGTHWTVLRSAETAGVGGARTASAAASFGV
jgi:hypothetical protein